MPDKLEKFIAENREEFDIYEPSPDLWKKIISEEKKTEIQTYRKLRIYSMRIAAVLLIAVISIVAYEQITKDKVDPTLVSNQNEMTVDPEIIELMEAESYYGNQVNMKMQELESYTAEFSDVRDDVLNDFKELDDAYADLLNELGSDIYKEEVITSMIENYRMKISILEEVLKQLKRFKNESTEEIKEI